MSITKLPNQTYQTIPTKSFRTNPSTQTYKPNLPNKTYQTKHIRPNLPNQTFLTKQRKQSKQSYNTSLASQSFSWASQSSAPACFKHTVKNRAT